MVTGKGRWDFRAPGYTITNEMLSKSVRTRLRLRLVGVSLSSVLHGENRDDWSGIRARGRESRSVVDDPRVLTAPIVPYRVGTPYWEFGEGLLEVPIQVTTGARLPVDRNKFDARWRARLQDARGDVYGLNVQP